MVSEPRYSDEEVALILQRAAELQKLSPLPGDSGGMSLGEIERVAQEAGLQGALVRRAALEIARPAVAPQRAHPLLGAPSRFHLERVLEGEFPVEQFDLLLEVIRGHTDQIGQSSTIGRTLTWTGPAVGNMPSPSSVSVAVRDGQTFIRVNRRMDQTIGGIFGGILGGFGGGLTPLAALGVGAVAGPAAAVGATVGFIGLVYWGCRKIYANQAAKVGDQSQGLVEALVRACQRQIDAHAV